MKKSGKVQTGLRIPEALYEILKQDAERTGVSINTQILYLIDVGLQAVNLGIREQGRALAHTQQDKAE